MQTMKELELPEGVRIADERLVRVTQAASSKIKKLIKQGSEGSYLRLAINGGGCNGLSYKMKFVDRLKRGDMIVEKDDAKVVVDMKSALYIKGTEFDYSDKLVGGGFKFTNPNAKSSCSCGESFSV